MAFQIPKPTNFGTDASYWRIGSVKLFIRGRHAVVTMEGFATMEAARAGALPMAKMDINLPYDEVEAYPEYDILRKQLYTTFKQGEDWALSEDV